MAQLSYDDLHHRITCRQMQWRFLRTPDSDPGFFTAWLRPRSLATEANRREREYQEVRTSIANVGLLPDVVVFRFHLRFSMLPAYSWKYVVLEQRESDRRIFHRWDRCWSRLFCTVIERYAGGTIIPVPCKRA